MTFFATSLIVAFLATPLAPTKGQAVSDPQHADTMKKASKSIHTPADQCKFPKFDLREQRFGRLVVKSFYGHLGRNSAWMCECDCGEMKVVRGECLKSGNTQSCGCFQQEARILNNTKHGYAGRGATGSASSEYNIWRHIRDRCLNPRSPKYNRYGGRGIKVCNEWAESFEVFLRDMGPKPPEKKSIHRMNNNGNYEPGNCVWADDFEQQQFTSRTVVLCDNSGLTMILSEWRHLLNKDHAGIMRMVARGELIKLPPPDEHAI